MRPPSQQSLLLAVATMASDLKPYALVDAQIVLWCGDGRLAARNQQ